VKKLVDRAGGLASFDMHLQESIILADSYTSATLLQPPAFPLDFDPGEHPVINEFIAKKSRQMTPPGHALLASKHQIIVPQTLSALVTRLSECTKLALIQEQGETFPQSALHWFHLRILAVRHGLLSVTYNDPRTEAIRIALIIWTLLSMTLMGSKQTVKHIAPKLRQVLERVHMRFWHGHEEVVLWILTVGVMSVSDNSQEHGWFIAETVHFGDKARVDLSSLRALASFSERFFYLPQVQHATLAAVVQKLSIACTQQRLTAWRASNIR
jgi:hypothetical protein